MSYLKFDKEQIINLEYSLNKEILRSNRAGSYSSTTLVGCNTRKYHGLLICPVKNFGNEKHVLLSSLDETILQNGSEFNLGIRRFKGGYYEPRGHKYIRDIEFAQTPKITYRVGNVILTKERLLIEKEEQVLIRYTLVDAQSETKIRFKPFLAFREIHRLSKANMEANTRYQPAKNGISVKLYNGYPDLFIQFSKKTDFIPVPDWYYNIEYLKELNRGYEFLEDLFVPGYFEIEIEKGETVVIAAGTTETKPALLKQRFSSEMETRSGKESFLKTLENAAGQFIMQNGENTDIIAGFPWYGSISRQTFIALPGLSFALNNPALFKQVLGTYIKHLKNGFFPDEINNHQQTFHSADTPLWYIWAIQQYHKIYPKPREIWKEFGDSIKEILEAFTKSTLKYVGTTTDGLVYAWKDGIPLTWMNSSVNGMPVVNRDGLPVEVNALWYNALCFSVELAKLANVKTTYVTEWSETAARVKVAFNKTFWNEGHEHLADVVKNGLADWSIKPNMVIAAALDYTPLTREQQKSVLSVAKKNLLTKRGLRTLSPDHLRYRGAVEGGHAERELAAHQGAVYPWLIQFFVEAYLKIHKRGGLPFVKHIMENFEEELTEHCVGTLSEMYNGNPPHKAKGAISQAINVAGVVYATLMVQNYND